MRNTASFERYLTSLVGSWQALAAPHHDAEIVRDDGFVAARFGRYPVLDNAVLLRPDAVRDRVVAQVTAPRLVHTSVLRPLVESPH